VLLALLIAGVLALPASAAAQVPPGAPPSIGIAPLPAPPAGDKATGAPAAPAQCNCPPVDIFGLLQPALDRMLPLAFDRILVQSLRIASSGLRGLVGAVTSSSFNFVTRTPPDVSYGHPKVGELSDKLRAVANAALALIALWGGVNVILRHHLAAPYHTAMELGPRLVVGALLVNTSDSWTRFVIDANNGLCEAVGGQSLPILERPESFSVVAIDLAATIVYLIACLLLVLQALMRLALVDVLIVVAPLGLAGWVLPQTQGWARLWSSSFAAAVFTQFLQVLALTFGGHMLLWAGPEALDVAAVRPFVATAALALALRIPRMVWSRFGAAPSLPFRVELPLAPAGPRPAGVQLALPGFGRYLR
jgi:hypothetical protein